MSLILTALLMSLAASPATISAPKEGVKMCAVPCRAKAKKKVAKAIVKPIVKAEKCCCCEVKAPVKADPTVVLGLRGAVGVAYCLPNGGFGLLGLRARFPKVRLGAEAYTEFYWGHGLQGLFYPVQGDNFNWHLNGGVYWVTNRPFLAPTTPRTLDLTLGTGVEVRLLGPLFLTGDVRFRTPNPVALGASASPGAAFAGAMGQTQFMLGVMLTAP